MQLAVQAFDKGEASTIKLNADVFSVVFNEAVIHQVITAYRANGRADTKGWKNRSAVRGGGAKPWRQKGTGRARAGTSRGPLWRSGGVTFGSGHADHTQKINKKMYHLAMKSILSEQLRRNNVEVFDKFDFDSIKTKNMTAFMSKHGLGRIMVIDLDHTDNFIMSCRNLPTVSLCDARLIDPVSLFGAEKVLISVEALKNLEERFS